MAEISHDAKNCFSSIWARLLSQADMLWHIMLRQFVRTHKSWAASPAFYVTKRDGSYNEGFKWSSFNAVQECKSANIGEPADVDMNWSLGSVLSQLLVSVHWWWWASDLNWETRSQGRRRKRFGKLTVSGLILGAATVSKWYIQSQKW